MSRYWYYYQGPINTGADGNPLNYARLSGDPSPTDACPVGGTTTCAIYSPPNSLNTAVPTALSQNLQDYLVLAKNLSTGYPVFPNKAFAYSKP